MQEVELLFLEDGGQSPDQIVEALIEFVDGATSTLDIMIYDAGLTGSVADRLSSSLNQAGSRGVSVRFGYYEGPHHSPVIPPPTGTSDAFAAQLTISTKPITGFQSLMHQKYVIRDWESSGACVWTGSTNWTNDSWSREENIILRIPSTQLAGFYHADFEQLWAAGNVDNSGGGAGGSAVLDFEGQQAPAGVWFSPAEGEEMARAVGDAIAAAQRRVVLASPVLTDGPILGALRDATQRAGLQLSGVYDATQMAEVHQQWASLPTGSWKNEAFAQIVAAGRLAGKRSTPFGPGTVHDYMHLKAIVVDDTVFTGSYNFSRSGESNAENLLRIDSAAFAQRCVDFIGRLATRYGS